MKIKHIQFVLIAAVLAAFIVSGCATAPKSATEGGFPLIDIVDAQVELANNSAFAVTEDVWKKNANTRVVGGTVNSEIVAKDLTITLEATSIQVPVKDGTDLSEWFLNIPRGLIATAHARNRDSKFAAVKDDKVITVTFTGVPEEAINQPIKIRVPYEYTNRLWDFHIPQDPNIRFEVYGVDIAAVVVGGAVNLDIEPKTFKIKFGGTKLSDGIALGTDITSWFTNIPRGLKAEVAEEAVPATDGKQSLTVKISGKTAIQLNENIKVIIPAAITTSGIALEIPASDKAKYDVGSYSKDSAENFELRTGSNWKGAISGWGLTGPQVFQMKDFTPVGIIQVQAESTYAIGEDGNFHWTGDAITYARLMAEARRLNAHAIIDVVIDANDQVSSTVVKRHVEANHQPTKLEVIKLAKGYITVEADLDGGGIIYVETIETTKRTTTGTALAITYAPAYQPAVGEGGTIGYAPSYPNQPAYPNERK